jgi:hypothetical protein
MAAYGEKQMAIDNIDLHHPNSGVAPSHPCSTCIPLATQDPTRALQ